MEKHSTNIALKLMDHARLLGIPVLIQNSLVAWSDSRYLILFPRTEAQAQIRISSHKPYEEERYALSLDANYPITALNEGIAFLEEEYGDGEIQALAERGGLAPAELPVGGGSRDGHLRGGRRGAVRRESGDHRDWVRRRNPRRVRASGPKPKWTRIKGGDLRGEWSGDD